MSVRVTNGLGFRRLAHTCANASNQRAWKAHSFLMLEQTGETIWRLMKRTDMSRLLSIAIALGLAFGLSAASAQTVGSGAQKQAGDYQVMNDNCTSMGEAGREQCLKSSKSTRADAGCEKLTDRDKRECMLDAFLKQHDRITGADQVPKSKVDASGGRQTR